MVIMSRIFTSRTCVKYPVQLHMESGPVVDLVPRVSSSRITIVVVVLVILEGLAKSPIVALGLMICIVNGINAGGIIYKL